jgi:hypothetical protein
MFKKLSLSIFALIICLFSLLNSNTDDANAHSARIIQYSRWVIDGCSTHTYEDWTTIRPIYGYSYIAEPHPVGVTHGSCNICKNKKGCSACKHPSILERVTRIIINWGTCSHGPRDVCGYIGGNP